MKQKTLKVIGRAALAALLVAAFLTAGHEDYTVEVVTEMQNNGSYAHYAEAHPTASDAELAELYIADRGK